ncbi:hypothetical protein ONZ45_g9175 [Pleurotus djamor]|nr:hypothetical protein ONZ45_g9175 [Pleurotus djamor]
MRKSKKRKSLAQIAMQSSASPIAKLPEEILSLIFILAAPRLELDDAVLPRDYEYPILDDIMRLKRSFPLVCKYWRRVARSTPNLWSTILASEPTHASKMIALSQSAPLHVIVSTSKLPLARPFIEPVGFRISELDIFVDDNFAPGSVGMEGAMETHVEESLLASISLHALFMLRIFSTKDAFISKGIPWKGLTSLRFLQLAHILPMDELPELPRLTNLHINSLLGVELRWLLRALVNLQSIQCVDVSHVSSAHPEDAALSSFQAILLPKLDKLKIVTTTLAALKLFDYIRPPRSVVIEAKYVNPRSDDASPLTYLSSLKNFIRSHYRGSSSRTQMLRISARKHPSVRVFVDISLGALDRPLLSLSFTTDNLETSDYVALLSALPLSNIRELALTTQVTDFALHTLTETWPLRLYDIHSKRLVKRAVYTRQIAQTVYAQISSQPPASVNEERKRCLRAVRAYGILSHRWGSHELTLEELENGRVDERNHGKFIKFCEIAGSQYQCRYVWIDTACINKQDQEELDASIPSMFTWYRNAHVCIVHLAETDTFEDIERDCWFTRGWTLQELLAPGGLAFYFRNWTRVDPTSPFDIIRKLDSPSDFSRQRWLNQKGERSALIRQCILNASDINENDLLGYTPDASDLEKVLNWLHRRETGVPEDRAYCVVSLLNVFLPVKYGEGCDEASRRLEEACYLVHGGVTDKIKPLRRRRPRSTHRIVGIRHDAPGICNEHHQLGSPLIIEVVPPFMFPQYKDPVKTLVLYMQFPLDDAYIQKFVSVSTAEGKLTLVDTMQGQDVPCRLIYSSRPGVSSSRALDAGSVGVGKRLER